MDLEQKSRRDLRVVLLLVAVAVVLHLPGIDWGLPQADAPGKTHPWGLDEIGPIGPIVELANAFLGTDLGAPQYPLFHYIFVAVFYAPYLLFELVTRGLVHPHTGYPFGFQDPAAGVHALLLIARGVSVLMAAGIVVSAFLTGKTLWGRRARIIAAVFVMLMYPMFYYGRLSNVDVPAMFWISLALLLFARALRDGLPVRRAIWLGLFAALAVGTKDQSYGILLFLPLAILPVHFRVLHEQGLTDLWSRWKAPFAGPLFLQRYTEWPAASCCIRQSSSGTSRLSGAGHLITAFTSSTRARRLAGSHEVEVELVGMGLSEEVAAGENTSPGSGHGGLILAATRRPALPRRAANSNRRFSLRHFNSVRGMR